MKCSIDQTGTLTNGGHGGKIGEDRRPFFDCGSQNQRRNEMKYSVRVLDKTRNVGDRDFLVRQIRRHFETWQEQSYGSQFELRWRGNSLVLITDSHELVAKWQQIERHYVANAISAKETVDDDLSNLVCYPLDSSFNSAA
jgi:hypothetical protein